MPKNGPRWDGLLKASPCSQPSLCEISWRRPSASHHKYVEVPPYHARTYRTRAGATSHSFVRLEPGEFLAAFLDDLYLVTTPARARLALDDVTRTVGRHAGVATNLGKTRVYRVSGGPPPLDVEALGPDVWCGGDTEPATCGFVALGVPIGHAEFMRRKLAARLEEERRLLQELPELPDMQGAWLPLLYCASPRAQHALGTVPPTDSAAYAAEHDRAVWTTLQRLLAEQDAQGREWDGQIAFLPAASGGFGLASAAYWAAWADALPVMLHRRPEVARRYAQELALGGAH